VASYVAVWGIFFGIFWSLESRERRLGDELTKYGLVTLATVTSSDPANHNTICFTYEVNGKPYSGCDNADFDKDASQLPVGSQAHITYDSRDPSIYCSCTAESLQSNSYWAPIVGAFWLGTFMWIAIMSSRLVLLRRPPKLVAPLKLRDPVSQPFQAFRRTWQRPGLPRWLWSGGFVTYDLPFSASEELARVRYSIRPEGLFDSLIAPGQLRGWTEGSRFRLTAHLPLVANSFDSILDGQIDEVTGGSRLVGTFRMRTYAVVFLLIWLILTTVIGLAITIGTLVDPSGWSPSPPPLYLGLIFPVFGIGLLAVGRLIARLQEKMILRRLDDLLGAREGGGQN
jgi:hypothetical protein